MKDIDKISELSDKCIDEHLLNDYLIPLEKEDLVDCMSDFAIWKNTQLVDILERLQDERFASHDRHDDWSAIQDIINQFKTIY